MFQGVYLPVITPFHSDGSLDVASLSKLCNRLVADNVAGLIPLGTTGEASALSSEERALVVETCAKAVAGTSVELIVGAGSNSTSATLDHMKEYEPYSPDGFLLVTPYYVRPSEEGIIAHFLAAADYAQELSAEIMLYNIPARAGRYVSTQGLLTLATHQQISGVKQAVGGIDDETIDLLAKAPADFSVLCGDDKFVAPMCFLGGQGAVAASAHIATQQWVQLVDEAIEGNVDLAKSIHESLLPIVTAAFLEPNPTVFKGALAALGEIESDFVRLPLVPAKKESVQALVDVANSFAGSNPAN